MTLKANLCLTLLCSLFALNLCGQAVTLQHFSTKKTVELKPSKTYTVLVCAPLEGYGNEGDVYRLTGNFTGSDADSIFFEARSIQVSGSEGTLRYTKKYAVSSTTPKQLAVAKTSVNAVSDERYGYRSWRKSLGSVLLFAGFVQMVTAIQIKSEPDQRRVFTIGIGTTAVGAALLIKRKPKRYILKKPKTGEWLFN
jgi:hypothetical protein